MQNLVQGSEEWKKFRQGGIGSSDAPTVLGESPFKTPFKLWEEKTGRSAGDFQNEAMARGHELEPRARQEYERLVGYATPPECLIHPTMPFIRASLDGINREKGVILEIKSGRKSHEMALAGKIPDYYRAQLAHQMCVADIPMVHYFSFDGENGILIKFERNEQYESGLITKEKAFWDLVVKDEPPEFVDNDYEVITDATAIQFAEQFRGLDEAIKHLEEEKAEARKALLDFAAGKRIICNGVLVYSALRRGAVNYKNIPQLEGVDLEPYRSKSINYTTVLVKR